MGQWTAKRKRALVRRADGTFKKWRGGRTKAQLKKKENTFQGIAVHIGKEYKRQHGRIARVGAIVRTKKKDGSYHRGAFWYVRTPKGWRKSGPQKPSRARIRAMCKKARKGR